MWSSYSTLSFGLQYLLARENGQDLVEYALLIALIGLFATASSRSLAIVLTTSLANIAVELGTE